MIEPGRALVNNPGVILYTAGAIKDDRGEKPYILVDGGMSDNQDQHCMEVNISFLISLVEKLEKMWCMQSQVGTVNSGDLLVKDAMLPSDTVSGDILMSTSTGAYTFAMASNYNRVGSYQ